MEFCALCMSKPEAYLYDSSFTNEWLAFPNSRVAIRLHKNTHELINTPAKVASELDRFSGKDGQRLYIAMTTGYGNQGDRIM